MKVRKLIACLAAVVVAGVTAAAQEPAAAKSEPKPQFNRQDLIKRFDQDGDGQLNEAERVAAREAMPSRAARTNQPAAAGSAADGRNEVVKRFDKNGDGVIDDSERTAARDELKKSRPAPEGSSNAVPARPAIDRQMVVKEFDKDGDGKLSDEERQAAMRAMRERMVAPGAPGDGPDLNSAAMIKRFDKNGDGQLGEAERTSMREEMQRRREQRRGPAPDTKPPEPKQD